LSNIKIVERKYNPQIARRLQNQGISRLMAKLYSARGVVNLSDLDHKLDKMLPPDSLLGLTKASEILFEAVQNQAKIVIVGDYDCDGATATALSMRFFRSLSVPVSYVVPNRKTMGYGLSLKLVDIILPINPDIVITVDNGIASIEAIEQLQKNKIKVIVTDHHLPGKTIPKADAIVNPNQPKCKFPSKNLSGVGVVFYLLIALRQILVKNGYSSFPLAHYLDLVAVGTIADLVSLDSNNRILIANGIKLIQQNKANAGIRALINIAKLNSHKISTSDIGFYLAPRINAAGRLADMTIGIETLLADDDLKASEYAMLLNNINIERRQIEQKMKQEANEILKQTDQLSLDQKSPVNCIYDPSWHLGVIGIVASKIKEQTQKPTFIFTASDNDNQKRIISGSGRSIRGLHLRDCLDLMAKQHPNLFITFGGHAMAAGATIEEENLDIFKQSFAKCARFICNETLEPVIETDGALEPEDLNINNACSIKENIWGQGFPQPLFFDNFIVEKWHNFKNNHWKLFVHNQKLKAKALYFNAPEDFTAPIKNDRVSFTFRLAINDYLDQFELNFIIDNLFVNNE